MELKITENEKTRTVKADTLIGFMIDNEAEEGNRKGIRSTTIYAGEEIDKYLLGAILAELCAGLVIKTFEDDPIFAETILHIMRDTIEEAEKNCVNSLSPEAKKKAVKKAMENLMEEFM